jgi:short-subunit dehydrogenase involved in D-alanine esterification of teichoic acids
MPSQIAFPTAYRIEISGWDQAENFFVENAELEWSGEHGKKVFLRHQLRDGAVVFVRLVTPSVSGQSFPIAYQAQNLNSIDSAGLQQVRLVQMQPHVAEATAEPEVPVETFAHK